MAHALLNRRAGSTASYIVSLTGIFFITLTLPTRACNLPLNWRADYSIEKYNTTIAHASIILQRDNGSVMYQSQTRAAGLLGAINDEELTETSRLIQAADKSWRLQSFQQQRKNDHYRHQQFNVTWNADNAQAQGEIDDKKFDVTTPVPVWDRSSVQLALMCSLYASPDTHELTYNVVDSGETTRYTFERRNNENVEVADKKYETVVLERTHGTRMTKLWLSPQLHYLPVKMEQFKKGSLHLRMKLDKFQQTP
jgi:hypothetical protein